MLQKFIQSALLLVVLFTTVQSYAQVSQAPDGIQFQALATDANGHPAAGRVIYVKDAIIAKTATGTIVYSETFKVTASSAGIFTIVLGKGTYASGVSSIANIDWANGPFFLNLKIAVEPTVPNASWNVNNEYVDLGTSQFWSVPYALYAGNVKGADGKLNTSDTAAMLKPYFTAINLKANTADVNISLDLKEILANKSISVTTDSASDTKYPSVKSIKTYVDAQVASATIADASSSVKGKILLAGDLAGTATLPTVPGLTSKEDKSNKSESVSIDGTSNSKYPSVKSVKDYVDSLIAAIPAPRPTALATDEFVASAGQTSFTLTRIPSSKVSMFVNGIRIPNAAYSFSGTALTFDANNNGSHSLVAGDRVQFDYSYLDN